MMNEESEGVKREKRLAWVNYFVARNLPMPEKGHSERLYSLLKGYQVG
jgi:hypothetical protein